MITYIKGILIEASPLKAILETGGIGYQILIPVSHYAKLPKTGEMVCLFISFIVREDSHTYYGFLTKTERDLFEKLIATSGIGPKTGLALLGHLDPIELQLALSQSDIPRICKVPGIGKKTAERLVIEMRDHMKNAVLSPSPCMTNPAISGEESLFQDALSALSHLGYQPLLVHKILKGILGEKGESLELSDLITQAIKRL